MTKVTIFKLKGSKEIYAFSINKEYIKIFKEQRNMKLFDIINIELDKYELMVFFNKNKSCQLSKDYLNDGETDIEIVSTVHESDSLSESCDFIYNMALNIEEELDEYPLKKKYLNLIKELTETITLCSEKELTSLNINTFKLFYHLFRNTFSEYADEFEEVL